MDGTTLPLEDEEESIVIDEHGTMTEFEVERAELEFEGQGIEMSLSKIRLRKETMEFKKRELELRVVNLTLRELLHRAQEQILDLKKLHSDHVQELEKDTQSQNNEQPQPSEPLPPVRNTTVRPLELATKDGPEPTAKQPTRENGTTLANKIIPFDSDTALKQQLKSLDVPNINHLHAMFDKAVDKVFYGHESQADSPTTGDDATSASSSEF